MLKDGSTPHSLAGSFTGSSDPLTHSAGGVGEGRWHPLIGLEHQQFSNWRGLWLASKLLIYYPNAFYYPHSELFTVDFLDRESTWNLKVMKKAPKQKLRLSSLVQTHQLYHAHLTVSSFKDIFFFIPEYPFY